MRIKKSNNNEYIRAQDVWVRNFTVFGRAGVNITNMTDKDDYQSVLRNETLNHSLGHNKISDETLNFSKVLIISDGYDFSRRHKTLVDFPKDIFVIAINGALAKWKLVSKEENLRPVNSYVVNNPYEECYRYLPLENKYYPPCVASIRTNHKFMKKYPGIIFMYEPSKEVGFTRMQSQVDKYSIDDYRNPVCAAIGLAYQFGVRKLMLMCCDDSFIDERDAAEKLENGLWMYPHHRKSHSIINANLYWLTHQEDKEVRVVDYSSGPKYDNAEYINTDEEAIEFFKNEE